MNVDKVVRYLLSVDSIFAKVFASAKVHTTIYLTRIGTDNFAIELQGEMGGKSGFATGSRAKNCYKLRVRS